MARFKDQLYRFMQGRHGPDQLYYALLIADFVCLLLRWITGWPLFGVLAAASLIWLTFRLLSRNHAARQRENAAFLRFWGKIRGFFTLTKNRLREFPTHVYHKCPHCHATLRLPRRRGSHTVRCPKCGDSFSMRVLWGKKN